MRYSLRLVILATTLVGVLLGLTRVVDGYGILLLVWLLAPIWAAFGWLYFRIHRGGSRP